MARSLICVENEVEASVAPVTPTEPAAKILEFPRSTGTPQVFFDELAEPVFERPRILDVPDQLPPPPALGGILIEPAEEPATDKRPGLETPLQPARLSQRLLATAIDAALVGLAFTLFAFIFFRITSSIPRVIAAAGVAAMVFVVFWFGYQYFLMVCSGTTPGLKMARLRVTRFDGKPVSRKGRRWRVLASVLSGLSLGLGYIWFLLDEDQLCWHDRITHTYIAPN